jgi:hypothetical protein
MAREKKPVPGSNEPPAEEEITVFVLKFKGGSQSVQKGFDVVSQAIAALGPATPANQRVIVHRAPAQIPAPANGTIIDAEHEDVVEENAAEDAGPETPAPATSGAPPKPRKGYTFMNDFNLTPAGVPSLKDYCTEKNPQTDNDKFLVASAWIQTHGGVDPFTGRHLFTAFRAMEWKPQVDMTQPMRTLKAKKSYYENPSSGKWKLTGIGLDAAKAIVKA